LDRFKRETIGSSPSFEALESCGVGTISRNLSSSSQR